MYDLAMKFTVSCDRLFTQLCMLSSLGNSSITSGLPTPGGLCARATVRPSFLVFFRACCTYFFSYSLFSSYLLPVSLSCFILAVPLCKCLGKHSCMSFTFPVAILNSTKLNSHSFNFSVFFLSFNNVGVGAVLLVAHRLLLGEIVRGQYVHEVLCVH